MLKQFADSDAVADAIETATDVMDADPPSIAQTLVALMKQLAKTAPFIGAAEDYAVDGHGAIRSVGDSSVEHWQCRTGHHAGRTAQGCVADR
jgi:hypothetical protein